jgi:putative YhdH/YhfP family quinone oxidoreductase
MKEQEFKALWVEKNDERITRSLITRRISDLPAGDLLVRVKYSSLNYKDALSASGNKGVTKKYPHTPGIDCAGIVEHSLVNDFQEGDEVIVSCFDLGMNTPGGFGQYIRVPSDWAVKLPAGISLRQSMIYGTAGFTAAQSVERIIQHGITPESGSVLVTGATGGVGSVAVAILAKLGYEVSAVTGKDADDFLTSLGAAEIIPRQKIAQTKRAMLRERWAAVVDTVGGYYLATAIKTTKYDGIVTCCGNVAGADIALTVYPFILRGVTLAGIDSAVAPMSKRQMIWQKIALEWRLDFIETLGHEIGLAELDAHIEAMLAGQLTGRTVINLQ